MQFAGILIDSLMIDRLKKKWVARSLFLLVIAISVCSNLWPLGDPDFSKLISWMEEYQNNTSSFLTADTIVLPVITTGNLVFVFFSIAVLFVYLFITVLYSRIYIGDKSENTLKSSILSYLKRLPVLIVFFLLLFIPALFLAGIAPVVIIVFVPALFLSPLLILFEKKNPFDAITYSYRYTKGAKFSIFWDLLTLFFMYQAAAMLLLSIMPAKSSAGILLDSFFTAYFVLASGRLSGVFYDRLCLHPLPQASNPLN